VPFRGTAVITTRLELLIFGMIIILGVGAALINYNFLKTGQIAERINNVSLSNQKLNEHDSQISDQNTKLLEAVIKQNILQNQQHKEIISMEKNDSNLVKNNSKNLAGNLTKAISDNKKQIDLILNRVKILQ
jgi:hypothetical protein